MISSIEDLFGLLEKLGGVATLDEIATQYGKENSVIIIEQHKMLIKNTLLCCEKVYYDKSTQTFNIINETKLEIQSKGNTNNNSSHTSELSKVVPLEKFEIAFRAFIEQADKNYISRNSNGLKVPFGYSKKPPCDGGYFEQSYGQGNASAAPFMYWRTISIYYIPSNERIFLGIRTDKSNKKKTHTKMETKPLKYQEIKKNFNVATYYETTKTNLNYEELYENFLNIVEEAIRLKVHD